MRGIKAKRERKARARDLANLERAVNHNYEQAAALRDAYIAEMWLRFWANVEIVALCTFMQHYMEILLAAPADASVRNMLDQLEKAIYFWPAAVEI
jgi:hypothetical protein